LVINCSVIEHIGLAGRYKAKEHNEDKDLKTMEFLRRIMKPRKTMLLTLPIGQDRVFPPFHRVYGNKRLPLILQGWDVVDKEYWVKDIQNFWRVTNKTNALNYQSSKH